MKNNILLGAGIVSLITGIAGAFFSDKSEKLSSKQKNVVNLISIILSVVGIAATISALDNKLAPEIEEESTEETTTTE